MIVRKYETSLLFILIYLLSLVGTVSSQAGLISDKYLKIKPLSSREHVERVLGKNDSTRVMVNYRSMEGLYVITYSRGTCEKGDEGIWVLPNGLVEEVYFVPAEDRPKLRLKDVILDRTNFKRRQVSDVLVHMDYYNEDAGITIGFDTKQKAVIEITIQPTREQKERYQCKQYKEK